ncbi:aryl carrier-like protein [Actinomycetospora succinea]|uniref:Aryl carrier-like protein n=1 Tax=Actinomycetospora succinea TaxID=663603 RepID=A0A4R6VMY1_9PSEU|nr:phosphopantetheine-binding protein [Actinomycetospora succinea]TDQ65333.1 aryl carrier-like protein [Actinomycetospora succinea]
MAAVTLDRDRLRADIAAALGEAPEDVGDDDDLMDLGLDSIRLMSLVEAWRAETGAEIGFVDLAEEPTVAAWSRLFNGA